MFSPELSEHEAKIKVNNNIIAEMRRSPISRILTLPCLNFTVELEALALNWKINCVEYNVAIYEKQVEWKRNSKIKGTITFNLSSVQRFLREKVHLKYSIIYLDLCHTVGKRFVEAAMYAHGKTNLLYITVMITRRKGFKHYLITDYELAIVKLKECGWIVVQEIKYNNNHSQMCTFKCKSI